MPVINRIAAFAEDLMEWRRDLRAHPEIGRQEFRTSAVVAETLRGWWIEATTGIAGTVHFIVQPAEENEGGRMMVDQGLFHHFPCDMVFGAHNDTGLPKGTMAAVEGSVSAPSDRLNITINGRGGHAARPHRTIDPVVVGSHIVLALQSIFARRTDPLDSTVISATGFHAGSAHNIIPNSATQIHHPGLDFNDAILPLGARFWAGLVERGLARADP